MHLRAASRQLETRLLALLATVCKHGEQYAHVLMPGYTHLQPAQPVRYTHWLLAVSASTLVDSLARARSH